MKKFLSVVLASVFLMFGSCSSDDNNQTATEPEFVPKFEMTVNGVDSNYAVPRLFKQENKIFCGLFSFDTSGRFGNFFLDLHTGTNTLTSKFYSFVGNSSNYFSMNYEIFDLEHQRIKGTFSGYLYSNPANLNSEKKYVSGSFDLKFDEVIPSILGQTNKAKINGIDWVRTFKYEAWPDHNYYFRKIQYDFNDKEYGIKIYYDLQTITTGTYNFQNTDITNKIQLFKFDVQTGTFINYVSSGTLNVTQKEGSIVSGTYNFTAVNPNNSSDVIQVTDGAFKFLYHNNSNNGDLNAILF